MYEIVNENGIKLFKDTDYYGHTNRIRTIRYSICLSGNIVYHRENGPAIVLHDMNGTIMRDEYFKYGKRHREDGPAIICYESESSQTIEYKTYYIDGKKIRDEFKIMIMDGLNKI